MGRVVEVEYIWKDDPEAVCRGFVAIGIEEMPGQFDEHIFFYFDDEDEFERAKDGFEHDFKIISD